VAVFNAAGAGADWRAVSDAETYSPRLLHFGWMSMETAKWSKTGTAFLRTESGSDDGRGFGSVFHHQATRRLGIFPGLFLARNPWAARI